MTNLEYLYVKLKLSKSYRLTKSVPLLAFSVALKIKTKNLTIK